VGKYPQVDFGLLSWVRAAPQRRAQPAFQSRDGAFDLCPLPILQFGEPSVHLSPEFGLCPATTAPLVKVDDAAANPERLSGVGMVVFSVVTGVGQDTVNADALAGSAECRSKQGRVLAGSIADQHVDQQVGRVVTDQRQLRPAMQPVAFLPSSIGIMRRAMPCFQAGGVEAGFLFAADQALLGGFVEDSIEQFAKPTFFSRRCCAL